MVPGVLLTWVLPLFAALAGLDRAGTLRIPTAFRVIRLARLARMFYRVPLFKDAWTLVRGLWDSAQTLMWTCVVIGLVTYIFAIFGLTVIVTPLQEKLASPEYAGDALDIEETLGLLDGLDKFMF